MYEVILQKNVDFRQQSCYFNKLNKISSMQTYSGTGNILLVFCYAGNSELQTGNVREKGPSCKRFFEIVEMLEHSLLCMHFSEKHLQCNFLIQYYAEEFNLTILLKENHTFFWIFYYKLFDVVISKHLHESIFDGVLGCRLQFRVFVKM